MRRGCDSALAPPPAMGKGALTARQEAEAERTRREEEKKAFKEAQELESLRRTFKRINKKGDGKISASDLIEELEFLGHTVSERRLRSPSGRSTTTMTAVSTGTSSGRCSFACATT